MDEKILKILIKQAKKAYKIGEIPVGCIIIKKNRIISKAYNLKEKKKNALCHAELIALKKAYKKNRDWRLDDCILITTLYPCPMCASAIYQSRIKEIYYINETKSIYNKKIAQKILFPDESKYKVKINKINYNDQLIDNFFKKIRKK